MFILDTNILVYYSRGESKVVDQIEQWLKDGETLAIPTLVEAELFSWPKLTEHNIQELHLALFPFVSLSLDSHTARMGASFRRNYQVHLIDAIIAAITYTHRATLVTRNIKDFKKIKEIKLLSL